jgi:phosphocarrier protein HPr
MKECTYTIQDHYGIHARPAGLLVRLAKSYASDVTLEHDIGKCDLKRLMALMGLGVKQGEKVTVKAEGADEDACIEAIAKFLAENV